MAMNIANALALAVLAYSMYALVQAYQLRVEAARLNVQAATLIRDVQDRIEAFKAEDETCPDTETSPK